MFHLHFDEIDSTQKFLKENYEQLSYEKNESNILVSAKTQTQGVGRNQNKWISYKNSLAFSFSLRPNKQLSLTPIEIGVLVRNFLFEHFKKNISLKWPNDLFNSNFSKCGGVIAQTINNDISIIGVGINLGSIDFGSNQFRYLPSTIDSTIFLSEEDYKKIPLILYQYILNNRFDRAEDLIAGFNSNCIHLNENVSITEDNNNISGKFIGIGKNGQALLALNEDTVEIYNGTLTLD